MKRLLMTIGIVALSGAAFSQNAYDALKLSQTNPVLGTARYSGMAGAFNALGGNPSAIKDNPAALGVYRSKDFTFTPSLYINNDGEVKAALDNFAFVCNFGSKKNKKGYVTSSLAINYNRLNNISRYSRVKGETVPFSLTDHIGWMGDGNDLHRDAKELNLLDAEGYSLFGGKYVDRGYTLSEKGHVGQWDIAYGMNISNMVYVGAALGINVVEYKQTAMYDENTLPGEEADHWFLDNYYEANGSGFNFRIGSIFRPIDEIRIGASFETPTYYDIHEYSDVTIGDDKADLTTQVSSKYDLRTPLKFKAGAGFVIGKKAMVGIDYQYENFQKIRMKVRDITIDSEADLAEEQMNKSHTVKLGGEVQVCEGFFLRGGLAYASSPVKNFTRREAEGTAKFRIITLPQESIFVTGGLGYKGKTFYCDLAYVFQNNKDYLYPSLPVDESEAMPEKEDLKTRNIIATFGWRF
ncbi:MAG: hypothetical protein J6T28_10250 [Paludibacteraceae bacterium]|nr:hypothetical protein [Paludibacteraceae bacterium]